MKTYTVGGWVRDRLLGREHAAGDRDWVVVGATPQQMTALGFRPVGRDFPVFLHPQTHEEYALARTERKSAPGYRGFVVHSAPEVTLEEDLARRDLTINAMALDEAGALVDPYGGERDLRAGILRHVGPAFVEDPVRVLRLARFAARFAGFTVAPETMELARRIVDGGEADALVPERAWQEISRGLMEERPSRMIEVMRDCGLLARWVPPMRIDAGLLAALDRSAAMGLGLAPRFAVLASALPDAQALGGLLARLRADQDSVQLAQALLALRGDLESAASADAGARLLVLERADAIRRPERFERLLDAAAALGATSAPDWRAALSAVRAVDAGAVAARHPGDPSAIAAALRQARMNSLSRSAGEGKG